MCRYGYLLNELSRAGSSALARLPVRSLTPLLLHARLHGSSHRVMFEEQNVMLLLLFIFVLVFLMLCCWLYWRWVHIAHVVCYDTHQRRFCGPGFVRGVDA